MRLSERSVVDTLLPVTSDVNGNFEVSKPAILQIGPYPEWDQGPLDEAFDVKRLFEAEDRGAFLADHGRPSARSQRAGNSVQIAR